MRPLVDWIAMSPLSQTLSQTSWVIPLVQTIHILSIAVILSSVLMIDLRVMGWSGKGQTLRWIVDRYSPWFWGALVVLALTGAVMIVTEPIRELMAISFWLKMAVLAVGIAAAVAFLRSLGRSEADWEVSKVATLKTRSFGVSVFVIWCVVIFLGRFIAYDPQIWGNLSPLY